MKNSPSRTPPIRRGEDGNYTALMDCLEGLRPLGIKPGLERIKVLLRLLGNPERHLRVIHVAGSNGKGSVCRMLESVLLEAGYRTGMFSSPHLVDFRERFRISGQMASSSALAAHYPALRRALEDSELKRLGGATFFEANTALAFLLFRSEACKIVVLETGLGGRFDSTNVVSKPLLTLITNISLEHTQILGNNESQIAWEKAGILRRGVPLVTGAKGRALMRIRRVFNTLQRGAVKVPLLAMAENENWRVLKREEYFGIRARQRVSMELLGKRFDLEIPLLGKYQIENLANVLAATELLKSRLSLKPDLIRRGLAKAYWPGRMQRIGQKPPLLLDGAHNPAGARLLAASLKGNYSGALHLVLGVLKDKNWRAMLRALAPLGARYYLCPPRSQRALEPIQLASYLKNKVLFRRPQIATFPSFSLALSAARRAAKKGELVLVTGSLYIVGEALEELQVPSF